MAIAVPPLDGEMTFDESDREAAAAAGELRKPDAIPCDSSHGRTQAVRPALFRSFFLGGFECSSHRRRDGRRLDLIAATRHDLLALEDYQQLSEHGIRTARDGVRWHQVEAVAGCYNWSSLLPMLRAAEAACVQVIWDLCHYGWPDHLDVFSAAFIEHFARYAAAFARLHLEETGRPPLVCPINEISYFAWAGGQVGRMNPGTRGRGPELKRQLVRATVAAIHAMRLTAAGTRVFAIDPLIHVVPGRGQDPRRAAAYTRAQFEAWDMLAGSRNPELGGAPDMLDVVGVNYYWNNQWVHRGRALTLDDPRRKPAQCAARQPTGALRPSFVPGRDEHRGRGEGGLAPRRCRGGARGHSWRRARRGHLPLSRAIAPRLEQRPHVSQWVVRDGAAARPPTGAHTHRRRTPPATGPVRRRCIRSAARPQIPSRHRDRQSAFHRMNCLAYRASFLTRCYRAELVRVRKTSIATHPGRGGIASLRSFVQPSPIPRYRPGRHCHLEPGSAGSHLRLVQTTRAGGGQHGSKGRALWRGCSQRMPRGHAGDES